MPTTHDMRRVPLAALAIVTTVSLSAAALLVPAAAKDDYMVNESYHDLIRPHGHPRSDAVHSADLAYCVAQTGQTSAPTLSNLLIPRDTPAFKKCMRTRGYKWTGTSTHEPPPGDIFWQNN